MLRLLVFLSLLVPGLCFAEDSLCPLSVGTRWEYQVERLRLSEGIKIKRKDKVVMACQGARDKTAFSKILWRENGKDHALFVQVEGAKITVKGEQSKIFVTVDFANKKLLGKFDKLGKNIFRGRTLKVGLAKVLKTKIGKLKATPVLLVIKNVGLIREKTIWFAPGVGPVRMIETIRTSDGFSKNTYELLKFTSPAAAPKKAGPKK
jgi:hypothetical protein